MIDGLIQGRISSDPTERISGNGNSFVTCRLRASAQTGETVGVNVIAFDRAVCVALLALAQGESVAITGPLTPKVWIPEVGEARVTVDVVAHAVLSPYSVNKKRRAAGAKTDE